MCFQRISPRSTQELQQQRIQFLGGCQLRPMISAIHPEVAETGVAVALRSAHLTLGEEDIALAPDADNRNLHVRECLAEQAQVRAVVIEASRESPGTRESRPDEPKLGRIVKH